jgi:hypothetical protein
MEVWGLTAGATTNANTANGTVTEAQIARIFKNEYLRAAGSALTTACSANGAPTWFHNGSYACVRFIASLL